VLNDQPFAVLLADDLIDAEVPVMQQMTAIAEREQYSVIGVMHVAPSEVSSYGIVETVDDASPLSRVARIVEKPKPGATSSSLAVVGRYILTPRIFHHLRTMPAGAGGEIQLTDGIARLMDDEKVLAYEFTGRRFDCGNKLGYLEATVELGLKHPEVGSGFAEYLNRRR
jgi:UTP--glucose-1-phosphate uridylyltransferase